MSKVKELFDKAHHNLNCNTSYPLDKSFWSGYRSDAKSTDGTKKTLTFPENLSLYFHIPFCNKICSFCEYTKFMKKDDSEEVAYIASLERELKDFLANNKVTHLYGLDIGGGTPTALTDANFESLLKLIKGYTATIPKAVDFMPSIEGTFETMTKEKAELIINYGYSRVSMGLQVYDERLLTRFNRVMTTEQYMREKLDMLYNLGIKHVNIDLMYGMNGQTEDTLNETLRALHHVRPDQVTIYETRYNMRGKPKNITRDLQYEHYTQLYSGLMQLGYTARFGENVFRLDPADTGMSSYLYSRMLHGTAYKGFGVAAQSMSNSGVSYNYGKGENAYEKLDNKVEDVYNLPKRETLAKYVAVSLYGGKISISAMESILGQPINAIFKEEVDFLISNQLVKVEEGYLTLTYRGFYHYGAIASLFYGESHKEYILNMED